MPRILAALLLASCGPPALEPPGQPVAWEIRDPSGDVQGDAWTWREGTRGWERTTVPGPDGETLTFEARTDLDGTWIQAWQVIEGRWRITTAGTSEAGASWSRRRGLAVDRRHWSEPPDVLHGASVLPGDPAWPTSLGAFAGLAARAPRTVGAAVKLDALDFVGGRRLDLRVEVREAATLALDGEPVPALRLFAWTAARGDTVWIRADDGALLAVDGLAGAVVRAGLVLPVPAVPPVPAGVVERQVALRAEGATLQGTLTLPAAASGPVPGVVLVHGSGPVDREGNVGGLRTWIFRRLAHRLSEAGFAVLRYDKRGAGESEVHEPAPPFTADLLVADIHRALDLLAALPEVDADRLFLVGHSEGGILTPWVAAERDDVGGVVMLAGPARELRDVMGEQLQLLLAAHGMTPEEIADAGRSQAVSFTLVASGKDADLPGEPSAGAAWIRSHFEHGHEATLAALDAPVLAVYGGQDLQVPRGEAEILRQLLPPDPAHEVVVVPDLDHLLMPVSASAGMGPYADPDRVVDPGVLDRVVAWLEARARE